jgi:2'-5' RNA ligase
MRLFVALTLPPEVRREAGRRIEAERRKLPRARWVHADNLHLTLVFLGEVEEGRVAALSTALTAAFGAHPPPTLQIVGAGTFPPPSRRGRPPRVAWIGVSCATGVEALRALHRDVSAAVQGAVDVTLDDRPYAPHLTLARPRETWRRDDVEAFVAAFREPTGGPFTLSAGHLMRSELGRGPGGGSLYTTVAELAFAEAA